jgi:uncharacterized protein YabN with tetrapyrrole methylase and pyrophosphatase domain
MAKEAHYFDFDDIVTGITRKLIRRHPHVFEKKTLSTAEMEAMTWQAHKALERHIMDNLWEQAKRFEQ